MNGKTHSLLSFVGAMKIARNVAASERHIEWYAPIPGSLREGAGGGLCHSPGCSLKSEGGGRFSSPLRNSKDLTLYHSSDDTPSVTPFGRASSLIEGAGNGLVPFIGVLAEIRGFGRFSLPLRKLCFLHFAVWRWSAPTKKAAECPAAF